MRVGRVRNYSGLVSAGVGAVGALYRGYKQYQGLRSMFGSKKQSNTGFITNQYDVKTQYRRRRMPRRRRKAWVRKVRMVNAITNNKLGTQLQMFRSFLTGTVPAGNQTSWSAGIYGENGVVATANDFGIDDLAQLNSYSADTSKMNTWHLKSAVVDIEISNIGGDGYNNSFTVDCYEIICRKSVNAQSASAIAGPSDMFVKGFGLQDLLGTATALGSTTPGVVPFQNAIFCHHFKILKKTRVLLSVGQATHFMFRDAKDRKIYNEPASRPVCSPGLYHGFLFVIQGIVDAGNYASACKFSTTAQRYYTYVNDEKNNVNAGYANI